MAPARCVVQLLRLAALVLSLDVASALRVNRTLLELGLVANGVGRASPPPAGAGRHASAAARQGRGAHSLMDALRENRGLRTLMLGYNAIRDCDVGGMLSKNDSLAAALISGRLLTKATSVETCSNASGVARRRRAERGEARARRAAGARKAHRRCAEHGEARNAAGA